GAGARHDHLRGGRGRRPWLGRGCAGRIAPDWHLFELCRRSGLDDRRPRHAVWAGSMAGRLGRLAHSASLHNGERRAIRPDAVCPARQACGADGREGMRSMSAAMASSTRSRAAPAAHWSRVVLLLTVVVLVIMPALLPQRAITTATQIQIAALFALAFNIL